MGTDKNITEVIRVFFKLGLFAFGGPAAHIAMMEDEVVQKRKWMDRQQFLDLIGATNLIPGPNSTEMTMHCGHARAGYKGLILGGLAFILPAILITGVLAWLYVKYGQLPEVKPFIIGIKPAVLAIIASAILKLGKKALKNFPLGMLGVGVLVLSLIGVNEVYALIGAGLFWAILAPVKNRFSNTSNGLLPLSVFHPGYLIVSKITTWKVFLTFLKVGAILYGSGYVLFAYLDAELVEKGWLSRQELLDAIAVGQFTPGPVLSTATFIGYQLNGFWGAVASTTGIFLPSFIFVLVLNPLIPKMQKSAFFRAFLDGVNVAAIAVMTGVLFFMGKEVLLDWKSILIASLSVFITFGLKKLNPMWTILCGAGLGYLLTLV
ncbi:MAG: chromate efflux transporter [Flavobacteriales bacterium]|nr:chromate efflux transporter [Flavobacteriales bacterium]